MIKQSSIAEVQQKSDILSIVQNYIQLRKRGRNYLGLCPFHHEKTPSFTVSPEKQICHCFGCGSGGDVFKFIMKVESLGFSESVEFLAEQLGIRLEYDKAYSQESRDIRQQYLEIMNEASGFYHSRKTDPLVQAYIQTRGFSVEQQARFRLGYGTESRRTLFEYLSAKGYRPDLLTTLGLVLETEDGSNQYVDRFSRRMIIPVRNVKGEVIAFGGRVIGDAVNQAKYVNSPDTPLYQKGKHLFALDLAKEAIRETGTALLMEGYLDVITAHQHGFLNTVAALGTAFTEDQARLLRRFTAKVICCLDQDSAGQEATVRTGRLLRAQGFETYVLNIPAKDVDELLRQPDGFTIMQSALKSARHYYDFMLDTCMAGVDFNNPESRSALVKRYSAVLKEEQDLVLRDFFLHKAAERTGISISLWKHEVDGSRQSMDIINMRRQRKESGSSDLTKDRYRQAEEALLYFASEDATLRNEIFELIKPEHFRYEPLQKIAVRLIESTNATDLLHSDVEVEEDNRTFREILLRNEGNSRAGIKDYIRLVQRNHLEQDIQKIKHDLSSAKLNQNLQSEAELQIKLNSQYKALHSIV